MDKDESIQFVNNWTEKLFNSIDNLTLLAQIQIKEGVYGIEVNVDIKNGPRDLSLNDYRKKIIEILDLPDGEILTTDIRKDLAGLNKSNVDELGHPALVT